MKASLLTFLCLAALCALLIVPASASAQQSCETLMSAQIPHVTITMATAISTPRASVQAASAQAGNTSSRSQVQGDPWTTSETVTPADLEKELNDSDPAKRPIVACVGFKFLYDGGHVPGASFHGPGSKPEGLADLRAWAASLPKSSNVVLYCGCCPLVRCPNLRPAFTALHDAGFARLRVLLLPTNFATDWAGKGYPIEKGKQESNSSGSN